AAAREAAGMPHAEDVATLDASLRIAVFAGDADAVPALRRRLAAAGYRHPEYRRFLAVHWPEEGTHE
ncbi:hypothetical protein, partial [Tahibacter caeni]|uniref:hypothetical protein n=1 Tax=Tahibacter caeni TaxID=1453545 RepID=UPI00214853CB